MYYTYAYLREDGTPYYIGKGKNNRVFNRKGHLQHGIFVPVKKKILFLKINLTEEEALKHEKYMIFVFGRKCNNSGILHNNLDESGSVFLTEEQKKKRNDAIKKAFQNPKNREKLRKNFLGKTHKDETKQKLRERQLLLPNNGISEKCRELSRKATSKEWTIEYPCGKIEKIVSLRSWCLKNNISYHSMKKLSQKLQKSHKGYKLL